MRIYFSLLVPLLCAGLQLTHGQGGIDDIIAAAAENVEMDYLTDLGTTVMQELDMVLLQEQYDELQATSSTRKKRKAIKNERYRWTSKTIPYKIAGGTFSSRDQNQITSAINEWQKYTCLKFTPAESRHKNHIYFDNGSGCYSYVGMIGGQQTVGLAGGCRYKGVIVHEIGHAVGFHHEQNRPDRDNHVIINRHNIPQNLYYNFKKYPYSAVETFGVPYDFGSVMHYGGRAFSMNGQLTIQTKNSADQSKIGNRKGLSFFDIKLANRMYKCNEGCSADIKCPGHGFVGKDCKCWCPGDPVKMCDDDGDTGNVRTTRSPTQPPTTTAPSCKDMNQYCGGWADAGYCPRSEYMKLYCKKSCKMCHDFVCEDSNQRCNAWAEGGYCKGEYADYMKNHCRKSCRVCSATRDEGSEEGGKNGVEKSVSGFWVCISGLLMFASASLSTYLP